MSAVVWKPNGEKCSETNLKDGNGVVVNYFIDGKKERKRNYKDGKLDGLETRWYKNGQKWTETNYKNGKKDGLETHWGWFGRESQTNYKDGIKVED